MIRLILADDSLLFIQGLKKLIAEVKDFEIVGEAENGAQAISLAKNTAFDVMLVDTVMPITNGIEATRRIIAANKSSRIIALTAQSSRTSVMEMLKAGAVGYILKSCDFCELESAIRIVAEGKAYISPSIANIVVEDYVSIVTGEGVGNLSHITHREREVLRLIAEGYSTKQIAFELGISGKTVETHRRNIMKKLEATSLAELVKAGIRMGLTTIE